MDLVEVAAPGPELAAVRDLFLEYAGSLNFSLCFQDFETELEGLPGAYAPPQGILLLAQSGGEVAGCVGVRPLDTGRCEMKRLYVRGQYRGSGLGRRLAEHAVAFARGAGYRSMLLDTLPQMAAAVRLYRELGFVPCASYYDNTPIGSNCLELQL
ncbi:MAG: GNAT family N-acetyltransferase [Burkholderiales bacterium]|nr:GNAT family N-acetyltransferase [Burkholderiales bacterium]